MEKKECEICAFRNSLVVNVKDPCPFFLQIFCSMHAYLIEKRVRLLLSWLSVPRFIIAVMFQVIIINIIDFISCFFCFCLRLVSCISLHRKQPCYQDISWFQGKQPWYQDIIGFRGDRQSSEMLMLLSWTTMLMMTMVSLVVLAITKMRDGDNDLLFFSCK